MTTGVYWFYQRSTDRAVYVGSSVNVERRIQEHRRMLQDGKHYNSHLQRTWNKYGADDFEMALLEPADAAQLKEREQFWMEAMPSWPTCNIAIAADNAMRGRKHTEETRQKLSRPFSDEHKQKLREARNQRGPTSDETRQKLSDAMQGNEHLLGHKHTEETKRKIGAVWAGRKHSEETKAKMRAARALQSPPTLGMKLSPCSEERKQKLSDAQKRYWAEKRQTST